MKVVFLDFDGVLNSQDYIETCAATGKDYKIDGHLGLDPIAILRLNRLVEAGAKFVISSTWRISYKKPRLQQMLTERGFSGKIVGATPQLPSGHRGTEIDSWIKWWGDQEPITSFAILDDSCDMEPFMDKLVRTDFQHGLQDNHVDLVLEMLYER